MITPMVDKSSAEMRRRDMLSANIQFANKKMNAGVAAVTTAPFAAEDNVVPTN